MTELAQRFRQFARNQCAGIAPLYEILALAVADDPELLSLASAAGASPVPNLLFAAVHRLLLSGPANARLARFYRSLTPDPEPPSTAPAAFRAFCLDHGAAIKATLAQRRVNTNEVQRCACLLPGFAWVVRNDAPQPLHLIEIGSSAGLNLRWDRYAYRYSNGRRAGPDRAPVVLDCALRGPHDLDVPAPWPPVIGRRIGIDVDPIDPENPEDLLWLRALIWPDRWERAERLQQAVTAARDMPVEAIKGDGATLLPRAIDGLPGNGTALIFHSFTLNQFSPDARSAFKAAINTLSTRRPLCLVALEWGTNATAILTATRIAGSRREERVLARCDSHGAWLEPIR